MDMKQKDVVALNNFCEHSHKIKSEEKKFRSCFCEIVNSGISTKTSTLKNIEDLSFKE